jgi:RES domain-containing protein
VRLWRIAATPWALDISCEGTRVHGGRWNPPGWAAMYAGTTVEICALEKFVHLAGMAPPPLSLVSIDLPDDPALLFQPPISALPPNWAELPAPASAQEFGRKWLMAPKQLAVLLPSAIVPEARVAMINPMHPRYREAKLRVVRDFSFDARMFKPGAGGR